AAQGATTARRRTASRIHRGRSPPLPRSNAHCPSEAFATESTGTPMPLLRGGGASGTVIHWVQEPSISWLLCMRARAYGRRWPVHLPRRPEQHLDVRRALDARPFARRRIREREAGVSLVSAGLHGCLRALSAARWHRHRSGRTGHLPPGSRQARGPLRCPRLAFGSGGSQASRRHRHLCEWSPRRLGPGCLDRSTREHLELRHACPAYPLGRTFLARSIPTVTITGLPRPFHSSGGTQETSDAHAPT